MIAWPVKCGKFKVVVQFGKKQVEHSTTSEPSSFARLRRADNEMKLPKSVA